MKIKKKKESRRTFKIEPEKKPSFPSNKSFRSRGFSSKRKETNKTIDDGDYLNNRYKKNEGKQHPFLPRRFYKQNGEEKRYETLNSLSKKKNVYLKKDRLLHSSFYMHKMHQNAIGRTSASIQQSRGKVSNQLNESSSKRIDLFE